MHTSLRVPLARPLRRLAVGLVAATMAAGAATVALSAPAQAVPVEGHTGWSVLLCKYSGTTAEPQTRAFYSQLLTDGGLGLGGVADYFADQSRGRVDLRGSTVQGWYTMPQTVAQASAKSRWDRIGDCVAAAAAGGYTVPAGNRIIAAVNTPIDSGAAGDRVLLDPNALNVGFAAHEMLHGYGLIHSLSDDTTYQNASWSRPGEYDDPWDQQSAMNIYAFNTARFGTSAVGLNGYHRDKLGWLGRDRVFTFGADGVGSRSMTISALEDAWAGGTQLIRIPFDPADIDHYYTVELRRKTGWSQAIPATTVLIHEVKKGEPYLLRQRTVSRDPVQSLNANGVTVQVTSTGWNTATVNITSNIVDRCVQGYVWREASPADHVCVTGATRSQAWADNWAKWGRWVNGAYGPHTCVNGYVWREAFYGDDVCVLPWVRSQAWADNAAAASRKNPAVQAQWGPNRCAAGYVWREADNSDYVCVAGATRQQAWNDNAAKWGRWVSGPYGPHTCISGYVWREAWPADDVCVLPWQRTQTASDNRTAGSRVANPGA